MGKFMFKYTKFYKKTCLILLSLCVAFAALASDIDHETLAKERAEKFARAQADLIPITAHDMILTDLNAFMTEYGAENIWVVYDIDDCVTFPDHEACLPCSYGDTHKDAFKELVKDLNPVELSIVWNLKYRTQISVLTEDTFPALLATLKDTGIRTIGLTASMAGAVLFPADRQHQVRHDILKSLGVTFNAPQEEIVFNQFPQFHKSHPVYYNGIGFAQTSANHGSTTKGEFLIALAQRWAQKPKAVFFIDDSSTNLHRFGQTMGEHDIAYRGYLYRSPIVHTTRTISPENYSQFIKLLITYAKVATHH